MNQLRKIKRIRAQQAKGVSSCSKCIFDNDKGKEIDGISCVTAECTGGVNSKPLVHYIYVDVKTKGRRA